jgi:hypothetical protein
MAAISSVTTTGISPNAGKKAIFIITPATADSGDTVDVTDSDVTGGETLSSVDWVVAWDQTTGDVVTATDSSGTITIDNGGGTTNHTYALLVIGDA